MRALKRDDNLLIVQSEENGCCEVVTREKAVPLNFENKLERNN